MSTGVAAPEDKVKKAASFGRVEHLSVAERAARGKAARAEVPRSTHAAWEPPTGRPSPVELLEEQAQTRVPELVPIRYGRMLVSPFTFYRGAAYLMASDLSGMPRTGLHAQLCGDAHLSNFGAFAAPDRRLVFSINDFDETLPGPFEWDVKRLVASFAVAGRDRGFDDKQREAVNLTVGTRLPRGDGRLRRHGQPRSLVHARRRRGDARASFGIVVTAKERKRAEKNLAKTRTKDSLKAFAKLTEIVDGEPRIVSDPPGRHTDRGDRRRGAAARARALPAQRHPLLPAHAGRRPPPPARALPLRPRGPQGRRRRQRRHARLHHAPARPRRRRPALPPVQGGRGLGAGAVPRQERVRQPRPARRRGPAADPGRERHHARLDPHRGLDGVKRDFYVRQLWDAKGSALVELMEPDADARLREASAAPSSHAPTPAPATRSRSRATSAPATPSTAPSPCSPSRTPTRTNATTTTLKQAVDDGRIKAETGV